MSIVIKNHFVPVTKAAVPAMHRMEDPRTAKEKKYYPYTFQEAARHQGYHIFVGANFVKTVQTDEEAAAFIHAENLEYAYNLRTLEEKARTKLSPVPSLPSSIEDIRDRK